MSAPLTSTHIAALTPSARRRCTDVVASHEAATVDVCLAGKVAALHLYTTAGRVVVIVPVDEIQKLRGPRDSNGVDFPRRNAAADLLVADAEAIQPKRRPAGEAVEIYERLWTQLLTNPHQKLAYLASSGCVTANAFSCWISNNHPGELKRLRAARA